VRALEQAVRSAATAVESSRRSFQAGSRTLVDILNAQGQYAGAQRDLAEARYNYLLSRIRLRALAGEADVGVIDEANGWLKP
jgi:outer membrane protein TolC